MGAGEAGKRQGTPVSTLDPCQDVRRHFSKPDIVFLTMLQLHQRHVASQSPSKPSRPGQDDVQQSQGQWRCQLLPNSSHCAVASLDSGTSTILLESSHVAEEEPPSQFQLRFSPALANKPKTASSSAGTEAKKPFNPFENPPEALIVAPIGSDHLLLLNKFAIVPEHSILITRTFKPQTQLLDAEDLEAAYACIRAYHDFPTEGHDKEELFVFFNCGEHSGASQAHRHLQLLPIARMKDGLPFQQKGAPGWTVFADPVPDEPVAHDPPGCGGGRPFFAFGERVSDSSKLHAVYLRLYRIACNATGGATTTEVDVAAGAEARISYNLAMTKDSMVIMPRTAEGAAVRDKQGREVGRIALNGTVLAGTALVKSEAEWEALRDDPEQLEEILGQIGVGPAAVGRDYGKIFRDVPSSIL